MKTSCEKPNLFPKTQKLVDEWRKLSLAEKCESIKILSHLQESASIESQFSDSDLQNDTSSEPTTHAVITGDIREDSVVEKIGSADMIFTSPPYNADIDYDTWRDNLPLNDYLEFSRNWITQCNKTLRPGGRFIINIRDLTTEKKRERYPAILAIHPIMKNLDYKWLGQHIWYKGREESSTGWGSWCSSSNPAIIDLYEYIFVFQKNGERKEGEDDIAKTDFVESVLGVWKIRPVKKIFRNKNILNHPCPFPVELARRAIKLYSHKNDTILDPFGGVMGTAIGAAFSNRNSVSVDISKNYCQEGVKRFKREIGYSYSAKVVIKK